MPEGLRKTGVFGLIRLSQRNNKRKGQIAQLVEQRIENPCVGGSIPPLATNQPLYAVIFLSVVK